MKKYIKYIPEWLGGLFVLIAIIFTAYSSILNERIQNTQKEREDLSKKHRHMWENHLLADSRNTSADILFMGAEKSKHTDYLFKKIATNLLGSILTMSFAANKEDSRLQEIWQEIQEPLDQVTKAKGSDQSAYSLAYSRLDSLINRFRLESRDSMNAVNAQKNKLDEKLIELKNCETYSRMVSGVLNILGVSIILLNSIWKQNGNDRKQNGNDRKQNGNDRKQNGNDRKQNGNDRKQNGNDG